MCANIPTLKLTASWNNFGHGFRRSSGWRGVRGIKKFENFRLNQVIRRSVNYCVSYVSNMIDSLVIYKSRRNS